MRQSGQNLQMLQYANQVESPRMPSRKPELRSPRGHSISSSIGIKLVIIVINVTNVLDILYVLNVHSSSNTATSAMLPGEQSELKIS